MACYHYRCYTYTVVVLLIGAFCQTINFADGQQNAKLKDTVDHHATKPIISDTDYSMWDIREPEPLESKQGQKASRTKRSIHREKVSGNEVAIESPYSSVVYVSVGCVGTLVSPIHVLTAAHCVHDGVKIRQGHRMKRLKIGMLRPNGKQHKIRVKKIYVSDEIRPTTESRFTYDYAILKLSRPHRKPYLDLKVAKTAVRSVKFHVIERGYSKRSTTMYKYTHCPVMYSNGFNYYRVLAKYCPSTSGNSGAAVFENSPTNTNSVIGIVSATAKYRSHLRGFIYTTVVLKLTDFEVDRIKGWIAEP